MHVHPDHEWQELVNDLKDACRDVFAKAAAEQRASISAMKEQRRTLLGRRKTIREQGGHIEEVKEKLDKVTNDINALQKLHWNKM